MSKAQLKQKLISIRNGAKITPVLYEIMEELEPVKPYGYGTAGWGMSNCTAGWRKSNWREAFKEEFGIHFKNSPDELKFAIAFIEEELEKAYKKGLENQDVSVATVCGYEAGLRECEEKIEKALAKQKEEFRKVVVRNKKGERGLPEERKWLSGYNQCGEDVLKSIKKL